MAFDRTQSNASSNNTRNATDDSWKSQGFLNLHLASGRKYGFIGLKVAKPAEAALMKQLSDTTLVPENELPIGATMDDKVTRASLAMLKLMRTLTIEFRSADESEASIDSELTALFGASPIAAPAPAKETTGREKPLGYLNFYLPSTNGSPMKLGESIVLKASVEIERGIYNACKADPKQADVLLRASRGEFRTVDAPKNNTLFALA